MRPPWIEAVALLAAQGHPIMSAADLKRPLMPKSPEGDLYPYCVMAEPGRARARPVVFKTLADLGRHIHRQREGQGLQLHNARSPCRDYRDRWGVSVFTLPDDLGPCRFLGWAWLNGGDFRVLEGALADLEPQRWAA